MPKLIIDNQPVEVPAGATILEAARKLGIDIPTLCYREECDPSTSCLVCVVKINDRERLVPACATKTEEGMRVESETEEIHQARRTALELLLSDHLGDCMAPCHSVCPARMNIPLMLRQIAADRLKDAIKTIKRDIALPAVLGRICPAPCEKGCRRKEHDDPVAICLLKRYVADRDLALPDPYRPECKKDTGKKVAIVGAGPTGLAAAYALRREGVACTIFDSHDQPGGMLQYAVPEDRLPRQVLQTEIATIKILGIHFELNTKIGKDITWDELHRRFDALLIATGECNPADLAMPQLETTAKGIKIDKQTNQTNLPEVFAAGSAVQPSQMAVRALADGKAAAYSIAQFLQGLPVTGLPKPFTVHIGRLKNNEINHFMQESVSDSRTPLPADAPEGLTPTQAQAQAHRCLHCDCRKPHTCKLRIYADRYQAKTNRYKSARRPFEQDRRHPNVIFEPGKCINCGLCVQIAAAAREELGLSFIGRGFNVRVKVPFRQSLAEGLQKVAAECIRACPTGALTFPSGEDPTLENITPS